MRSTRPRTPRCAACRTRAAGARCVARRLRRDQGQLGHRVVQPSPHRARRARRSEAPNPNAPIKKGMKTRLHPEAARQPVRGVRALGHRRGRSRSSAARTGSRPVRRGGVVADLRSSTRGPAEGRRDHHRRQRPQRGRARAQAGRAARREDRRHGLRRGARRAQRLHQPGHDGSWSARARCKSIAKQIGDKGEIAILSATANATNQNAWIKFMKDELKKPEYKDIKLVKVAYGDDDDQKSFQETQGLLQAYPNLKGIISPDHGGHRRRRPLPVDLAVQGQGQADRARLRRTRCASSSRTARSRSSSCGYPRTLGYLAGHAAAALVVRAHHRQGGREVQGRAPGRVHDRRQRRDRARPADRRSTRTTSTSSTSRNRHDRHGQHTSAGGRRPSARASRPGRGVRDRPRDVLAPVRGAAASGSRATSGASRSASAPWARRWSRPASSTRRRAPAPPVSASRPRASTSCSATP